MIKRLLGASLAVIGGLCAASGPSLAADPAQAGIHGGSIIRTGGYYYRGACGDRSYRCGKRRRYYGDRRYWDDDRDNWRERRWRWREWERRRAWWWRHRGRYEFCWRHPYHWRCYNDYY